MRKHVLKLVASSLDPVKNNEMKWKFTNRLSKSDKFNAVQNCVSEHDKAHPAM